MAVQERQGMKNEEVVQRLASLKDNGVLQDFSRNAHKGTYTVKLRSGHTVTKTASKLGPYLDGVQAGLVESLFVSRGISSRHNRP